MDTSMKGGGDLKKVDSVVAFCHYCLGELYDRDTAYKISSNTYICDDEYCLAEWAKEELEKITICADGGE